MGKIFKSLFFALLALVVLVGTLFIENGSRMEAALVIDRDVIAATDEQGATVISGGETQSFTDETVLRVGDTLQTSNNQAAVIRFDIHGVLRLSPLTSITFVSQTEDGYIFDLRQGSIWGNNLSASSGLNIVAGGALLMPQRASFDGSFDGETTRARVFSGQVNVGLIDAQYASDQVFFSRSDSLINSFLVADGSQAVIAQSKVRDNAQLLRQLLYSKLIKEFQYSLMNPATLGTDQWLTQNLAADKSLLSTIAAEELENITNRGLHYGSLDSLSYELDKLFVRLSETFTFTSKKRVEHLVQNIFEQVGDAKYLYAFGREAEGRERITLFEQLIHEGVDQGQQIFDEVVLDRLWQEYSQIQFVVPTNSLYDVKVALSDLLLARIDGDAEATIAKLGLIRDYMNVAYALADTSQLDARLALQDYFNRFQDFVENDVAGISSVSYLLAEENQIMDNLLRQYPQFYQDSFFAMKNFLEEEWLKFIPEGTLKNEERQTLISTKIDFLKQLQTFFLDERIALADARLVVFRLINEIKDLQPGTDVGVSGLFALRLEDYGNFLRFLNTTNVSQLRGSSPQGAYDNFLALQQEQLSIEQVIQEFLGEEVTAPSTTVENVLEQVSEDFESIGVTNLQIESLSDPTARFVEIINGDIQGVSFSGDYDWNRKLISNVQSGGVVLADAAIRLSSLPLLLQPQEPTEPMEPVEEPTEPVEEPTTTQAERVAKILLLQKLAVNGVKVAEENVVIEDFNAGEFTVNGATLADSPEVQMAFFFQNKTNVVSSLIIRTRDGDKQVADPYDIAQLAAVANQVYTQAEQAAATPGPSPSPSPAPAPSPSPSPNPNPVPVQ